MPIDPSIITSGNQMAPVRLPDVNAMMQTRTAELENIYKIEQQRAEQAKAAQKEQEAALVEALAPAYATAFKGGGSREAITAAYGLLPPEIQSSVKGQIDRLLAMPSDDLRLSALEASMAGSEMGRALLDRVLTPYQEGMLGVQRGQLDVSRQELELRRQKQALDAQGVGEWKLEPGEGGFFWTNPRTLEVIPADVTGARAAAPGAAPGPTPIPSPDAVTPRQPAPGAPGTAPISTERPPAEFRPKQPKGAATDQTQEERRRAASVRYTVKNANRVAEIIDKNPAAFGQGADEFVLSLIPFGAGEDFMAFAQDADRQQLNYRMTQIVATLLRLETGAAYTKPELVTEAKSFMQTYGDKPETARDKLDALQDRVASAVGSTGRAWTPEDQAQYDAAMMALETMKDKLYPAGNSGEELPEGATTSNW